MLYVDDLRLPLGRMLMSHLIADSPEELRQAADRLGLHRKYIQYPGTWKEHLDVLQVQAGPGHPRAGSPAGQRPGDGPHAPGTPGGRAGAECGMTIRQRNTQRPAGDNFQHTGNPRHCSPQPRHRT